MKPKTNAQMADEKEKIGREKTLKLFGEKIQLYASLDRFAVWDLSGSTKYFLNTKQNDFYLEIKDRDIASDSYSTDFLELSKYQDLMEFDNNADHYYLCFFMDDKARMYDLGQLNLATVDIRWGKYPSDINKDIQVDKLMIHLPTSTAKTYKL